MKSPKFDDDFPDVPTRRGLAQGKSIERQMIDAVGGSDSFRTVIRNNQDGTTTILRTRGGWPSFATSEPKIVTEGSLLVYLESGILSALTDTDTPANWNGLDIVADPNFHKWVEATTDKLGNYTSGPLFASPSASMVAASKKNLALKIPASVYSGKMRLFMQSQYGSAESAGYSLIERGPAERGDIAVVGGLAVCKYPNRMASTYETVDDFRPNVFSVQYLGTELGFLADNSCGVFASGGNYWLISITRSSTAFTVTAYPLALDERVVEFSSRLSTLYANPDQASVRKSIAQCEAYLFAHSTPVIGGALTLGTFDLGTSGLGDPIAYGWHFNSMGSEAKMVIHHLTPTTLTHMRWSSRTLTMSLAFAPNSGPITASNFTCTITAQNNGDWANPNGVLLYAPCFEGYDDTQEYPTRLHITSIASQAFSGEWDAEEGGEINDIPIYGFYVDNVWKPLTMSRKTGPNNTHIQISATNCVSTWGLGDMGDVDVSYDNVTQLDLIYKTDPHASYCNSEEAGSITYFRHGLTRGINHQLAFNGVSVTGELPVDLHTTPPQDQSDYRTTAITSVSVGSVGDLASPSHGDAPWGLISRSTPANDAIEQQITAFYEACAEERAALAPHTGLEVDIHTEYTAAISVTCETTNSYRSLYGDSVSAVIPACDSESIILLQGQEENWVQYHHSIVSTVVPSRFTILGHKHYIAWDGPAYYSGPSDVYGVVVVPDTSFDRDNVFPSGANDSVIKPILPDTEASRYLTRQGTKSCPRKPDPLPFWLPQSSYFDEGMYSMTSVLDHFNCSEGLRSDSGMDAKQRFCGWI